MMPNCIIDGNTRLITTLVKDFDLSEWFFSRREKEITLSKGTEKDFSERCQVGFLKSKPFIY